MLEEPLTAIEPEAEEIWHQAWLVEPDQFKVAVPVLEIFKVWPDGVAPPEVPEKEKVVGERTMWGLEAAVLVAMQMGLELPPLTPEQFQVEEVPGVGKDGERGLDVPMLQKEPL